MNASRFLAVIMTVLSLVSVPVLAQDFSISINVAPPPLVVEDQPPCPDDGYLWTPGYWAYDQDAQEYYWVDGAWVQPPEVDVLWTPSYWGWDGNDYVYYPGYWGPTVGFYGGINYGHGYWGHGYGGGRWNGNQFAYNTAANNVPRDRIHNVYEDRSVVRSSSHRVSFNGGKGGIQTKPTPAEMQFRQQSHTPATAQQQTHFQQAAQTRSHQVKVNGAKPGAATANNQAKPPTPAGSQAFTGGEPQTQERTPAPEQKAAPAPQPQPGSQPFNGGEPKEQERPPVSEQKPPTEQHVPQAVTGNETQVEHKPEQVPERPAPQMAPQQQPKPEVKQEPQHSAPPQQHAPAPAQGQNKPQEQPQGQGKPDSHP